MFYQHECNALAAAPSILAKMMQVAKPQVSALADNLRWMQTGAMRFDQERRKQLLAMLPNTRLFLHYGLSEAMRVTFFEANAYPDKLHAEGPASAGVELQIVDDNLEPVAQGEEGLSQFVAQTCASAISINPNGTRCFAAAGL